MRRRAFVSALSAGALAAGTGLVGGQAGSIAAPGQGPLGRRLHAQTATPVAGFDDGLAHPIPYTPPLGTGKDRALVLSGGGIYMLAFYVGYVGELQNQGIDLSNAEAMVGTSAGSVFGAILAAGKVPALAQELDAIGEFPWIMAKLVPDSNRTPGQLRASKAAADATDPTLETIQGLGRAAMAAHNADGPDAYYKVVSEVIGITDWPSPALHTTAMDCYTGERLVVSQENDVPIAVACAASSSLPGQIGPTWVKDRLCMDGAMSGSNTHCDVVAGAKRTLVISLTEGGPGPVKTGITNSGMWRPISEEIDLLEKSGSKTMLVVAGLEPGVTKIDSNMDPKYILPQIAFGKQRATEDADKIKAFWS